MSNMVRLRAWLAMGLLLTGVSCADVEPLPPPPEPAPRVPVQTCFAPEGMGNPQTIEDAVRLINALEPPVTVPCFLESLDRPIVVEASKSIQSAQPAFGPNNPRFLIHRGELVISAVPKGDGRPIVEFSVEVPTGSGESVKGEVVFPVTEELPLDAAYTQIQSELGGTKCVHCHIGEEATDLTEADGAFVSFRLDTLRRNRVEPEYIDWFYGECDPDKEPDRCAVLDSILGFGEVVHIPIADSPTSQPGQEF